MTNRFSHGRRGVTLIELLIAMVLGLVVAGGIVTVFISTSNSNRVQVQLAQLQENGRYAVTRVSNDLRMANGQYCSSTGGIASNTGSNSIYMDGLRTPKVYAKDLLGALKDVTTNWGSGPYPAAPTAPYYLPAFLSMRGYDCKKDTCTPDMPASLLPLPGMGTGIGKRVVAASVLTLRYMDPARGWALDGVDSKTTTDPDDKMGRLLSIAVKPSGNEPALSDFKPGDLAMLADCSNAQIFAVDPPSSAGVLTVRDADNFVGASPVGQQPSSAPRLFNVNTDMLTVTYFLQVVDNGGGQTTGALMRRVNGTSEEVVRGVERLDFLYGVEDINGGTRYLSASDVDTRVAGTFNCPVSVPNIDSSAPNINPAGCLWRAVKSIEVHMLMDGVTPLHTLAADGMNYVYAADGNTSPKGPDDAGRAVKPVEQGFPNPVLRREFSALVSLRNYNP